ncbi:Moesin/ezrin/radixin 2 [Clonorchis sinensis]|uniref:Moesin/ezrin/radixin 2 n=1 Tax=Clonorchis sinensis TaxID=79923 RepID=A0A8T1MA30_CLOSI|nr:Moesin/ezrin/radixin 2 [Clonorchis sinensis]
MRWYRGPSKKLLRIKVTSHESELEFNLSSKSTGKYLFDLVCSTIGLRETWYFGLQSYTLLPNGRMRLSQWLKLDKKIVSQKDENGQKLRCFFFHTKFFPEDIEQELIQATTRHLFYLSVKATILNRNETNVNGNLSGDLCPSMDVAILLASLAAQAEYGDVCEDDLDGKDESPFLPHRLLRLLPKTLIHQVQSNQSLAQKLKDCYKSYKGITRDKAELQYLKVAQLHHLFGVDYFPIVCVRMKCPRTLSLTRYLTRNELTPWHSWDKHHTNAWLGVTAAGIQLYGKNQRERPRYTFQWNIIKNVSYRERKFTVKLVDNWQCSKKTSTSHSSSAGGTSSAPAAGLTDALNQQTGGQRPRQSSRSTGGRSPLMGSGGPTLTNLNVSSGACGSGASAASLPSTPLSARLMLPAVSSTCSGSGLGLPTNARIHRDISYERPSRHGGHSPTVVKNSSRMFKFESGCIPGLTPIASRCSTNDLLIVSSGTCLTAPRVQTTDSSGAGSSASSKSSFAAHHRSNSNPLISVVEVWLADPSQAKTVMSMCAGNHALFMRRRQPDSVEVQQMRAQAREERARREVERSRLARARAEKAEAVEAKLALESKCAQLERALRQQQELQQMFLSGAIPTGDHTESVREKNNIVRPRSTNSSLRFPSTGRKVLREPSDDERFRTQICPSTEQPHRRVTDPTSDGVDGLSGEQPVDERHQSDIHFGRCVFYRSDERVAQNGGDLGDFEEYSWDQLPREQVCLPNGQGHAYTCQTYGQHPQPLMHHRQPLKMYTNGSASTPATPFARRAAAVAEREMRPPNYTPQLSRRNPTENASFFSSGMLDPIHYPPAETNHRAGHIGSQPHCFHGSGMALGHMLGAMKPGCYPADPHQPYGLRFLPPHLCTHSPGSLPVLNGGYYGFTYPPIPTYPDGDRWSYPPKPLYSSSSSSMANPPYYSVAQSSSRPPPFIQQPGFPFVQHRDEWYSSQFPPVSVHRHPQSSITHISTSLSAILSPIAGQRWHHPQLKNPSVDDQEVKFFPDSLGLDDPAQHKHASIYHRSVPLLDRSVSQLHCAAPLGFDPYLVQHQQNNSTAQIPLDWQQLSTNPSLGYSLQRLSDPSAGLETNSNEGLSILPGILSETNDIGSRQLTGTGSHLWPGESFPGAPGHLAAPPQPQRQCEELLNDGPTAEAFQAGHLRLNSVQRGYLSCRLQEERARFALLQAQFSKQLCDTWACLQVTRSPGELKSSELYSPILRNQANSNDLRLDPAGASDGASTGGGCGTGQVPGTSSAYVALDQLCIGLHENESSEAQQPTQPNQLVWEQSEPNMEDLSTNEMTCDPFMDELGQNRTVLERDNDAYHHPSIPRVSPECWCPALPHLHPSDPNVHSCSEHCCQNCQMRAPLLHLHGKPSA